MLAFQGYAERLANTSYDDPMSFTVLSLTTGEGHVHEDREWSWSHDMISYHGKPRSTKKVVASTIHNSGTSIKPGSA